jgi:glycosyltransferase involved in cell wall biosynthesis
LPASRDGIVDARMSAAEDLDPSPTPTQGSHFKPETPGSVLFVTPLWGRDGGVAAHVRESAAALARDGVDVHVLAARFDSDEHVPGVNLYHRPELLNARASVATRLGEPPAAWPEVTHIHQLDDRAIVEALRLRAPLVISAHGYPGCTSGVYYFEPGHECTRAHGPGCIPNLMARGCAHTRHPKTLPLKYRGVSRGMAVLRRADLVVSYSSAVDRHLAANGLPRRAVVPYFPTLTPKLGAGHSDRRRIVFAGRLVPSKGVDVLIRATAEVDAELVICGDGRQQDELQSLAQRLGVASRIQFKGWMGAEELADELANASVLAVPSVWPEPFGIVGIEALAAGRPAIGSATGGIVDWLQDGVCGLQVAPGDADALALALGELLDDPDRQRTMGAAGRDVVAARFSAERHVATVMEAYRSARRTWRSERGAAAEGA